MKAETIDFKGQLLPGREGVADGDRVKSLLLKVVDPLFKKKNGTGSAIPIKIGGTPSAPAFGSTPIAFWP